MTHTISGDIDRQIGPAPSRKSHTRRDFLKLSAGGALSTMLAVEGCNRQTESTAGSDERIANPARFNGVLSQEAGGERTISADTPLRIAMVELPALLDPSLFEVIEAYPFGLSVYDGLLWLDLDLVPQPMLAERWESTPDGLTWTFFLRRDVVFHHGTPFTAQDVVHTITRLLDPERETTFGAILNFIATVEAIDEYTVDFILSRPNVEFPILLAAPQTYIVPQDYTDELLLSHPSGTGPFLLIELVPGSSMTFARNPVYWAAEQIMIEEMQLIAIKSFAAQVAAIEQGEIDLLLDIDLPYLAQLQENPQIEVLERPSGRYQNIAMQTTESPFDDLRIRQALKHCMDRVTLRSRVLGPHGEIANDHPIPATNALWSDLPALAYDPAQARALLAEAGYPEGIKLQLLTAEAAPGMVTFAETFRDMAAEANIEIEVIIARISGDIYFSEYWGRVPFYVSVWEYRPSLHETFGIAYRSDSPWNETGWSNQELDELLLAAAGEADETERRKRYQAIEQIMIEEGAVIIPYFQPTFRAVRTHVQGIVPHPTGWLTLRGVQMVPTAM